MNKQSKELKYHLIDAKGQILGRLASLVARKLYGKDKVDFQPNQASGDFVVIINSDKIRLSGEKATKKIYYRHSGFPGGIKNISFDKLMEKDSRKVVTLAIKGMIPKNKLGSMAMKNLRVYKDDKHEFTDKFDK